MLSKGGISKDTLYLLLIDIFESVLKTHNNKIYEISHALLTHLKVNLTFIKICFDLPVLISTRHVVMRI